LGAIAAIVVLVLLSSLAAAVVRLSWVQQTSVAQDIEATRADQAAQAGIQWALYQALRGTWASGCGAASTLDLRSDTGFRVTVSCSATEYFEGESAAGTPQRIRLYTLSAVACNGSATTCPDGSSVARPTYVERKKSAQAVTSL
jgi:MSHA biogenesis protein MshP